MPWDCFCPDCGNCCVGGMTDDPEEMEKEQLEYKGKNITCSSCDCFFSFDTGEVVMEHPGLKNLYQEVVSGQHKWTRWGLLGVLCDYVLYYTEGDMIEIGCGESSIYLSQLAEKYNRICHHVEYSVSGVHNMKTTKGYFGKNSKVYNMKSEEFFKSHKNTLCNIALAFIDGDHEYEVVLQDFENVADLMVPNGYVFLHDTLPPNDSWKVPHKCGTVYKLLADLEEWDRELIDVFSFPKSAFDVGLTMVRFKDVPDRYRSQFGVG